MTQTDTIDIEAHDANARVEAMEAALAADPTAADAAVKQPTTILADLMAETSDRIEGIGHCMIDVAGAMAGGNSAWAQNQCQAAAAAARRAADLFDRIAECFADPPTAKALVKRLPKPDRQCLAEAIDQARKAGSQLWAVVGEKAPDKDPWEWTLLMTHPDGEKAASSRENWKEQRCTRSTHAVRVV